MNWKDHLLGISLAAVGIAVTIGTALFITVNSNAAEEIVIGVFDWTNNHEREQAEIDARIVAAKAEGFAEGTADLEQRIAAAKAEGFAEGTADLEQRIAAAKAEGFRIANDDVERRIANAEGKAFGEGFDQGKAVGWAELERSICPVRGKTESETASECCRHLPARRR